MSLHVAFSYLVETLREVKTVKALRVLDEGAFLVTLTPLGFDENIMVYLLAGELSLEFIRKAVNSNTRAEVHTLFILSRDLLPEAGSICHPDRSLRLLLDLYAGKVYAYRVTARTVEVFPVFVRGDGSVTYGEPVNVTDLSSAYAVVNSNVIRGVRMVAAFEARQFHHAGRTGARTARDPLQPFYELLGIPITATLAEVKRAYRKQARLNHPDADRSPDATARMQRINEAYEHILKRFE